MSSASQATGAESDQPRGESKGSAGGRVQITLDDGKSRHIGWLIALVVIGGLLLWKVGTVGQGVGVLLLGLAGFRVYWITIALAHGAGKIAVEGDSATLPRGLYKDGDEVDLSDIKHAFFLRRAVPWTRSGPMLIIETEGQIYSYPRDWFRSDSDQRRVAMAINKRLGRI